MKKKKSDQSKRNQLELSKHEESRRKAAFFNTMKFTIITLFPDIFTSLESYSVIGRAIGKEKITLNVINLRDFGIGNYHQVDDKPYGGNVGMLLRIDVLYQALEKAKGQALKNHKIFILSAEGKIYNQEKAESFTKLDEVILICGHYEGFDARIDKYIDGKISIGPYILTGGEIAAMSIIDSVSRLLPGVLGKDESSHEESFSSQDDRSLLEYPQYTRPFEFKGDKVPEELLSGDPKKIRKWQNENRFK